MMNGIDTDEISITEAAAAGPPPGPSRSPHYCVRIRPTSGGIAWDLREIWDYRELLFNLVARDVKLRYKQTALGIVWVVLQPLLTSAIFAFVFGLVAGMPSAEAPYLLLAYTGFLGWNLFQRACSQASGSLVSGAQLIQKVYFPRIFLPVSASASALVDFAVAMVVLAAMLVGFGEAPGPVPLLPVWMALLMALALGIGLFAGALSVPYRDVQYALPLMLQLLMYISPVAYPARAVPERWRALYYLNPMASLIEATRWSLLGTGPPPLTSLAYSAAVAALAMAAGVAFFKRAERTFADVI